MRHPNSRAGCERCERAAVIGGKVDVEPRGQGNKNYGWDVTEGFECFEPANDCDTAASW